MAELWKSFKPYYNWNTFNTQNIKYGCKYV